MIEGTVFHKSVDSSVYLKLLERSDVPELHAAIEKNRQHLITWLPWIDSTRTVTDSETFVSDNLRKYARGENLITGIWQQAHLIGCIGFNHINYLQQKAAIGYWIAAVYQGKGIITRSCRLLIDYAFEELHLQRIEILCAVKNHSSRAVAQRLQFKQEIIIENYIRLYNQYVDVVLYSMSQQEWATIKEQIK